MKVMVAAQGWDYPGTSMYTHAREVVKALETAGIEASSYAIHSERGAMIGGLVRPLIRGYLKQYPEHSSDVVVHHTSHDVLRGVDVVTIHDLYPFHYDQRVIADRFTQMAIRRACRVAKRVIVTTEQMRREMLATELCGADKIRVIPVPFEAISTSLLIDGLKPRLTDRYDGVWIGRYAPNKNFEQFVRLVWDFPGMKFAARVTQSPGRPFLGYSVGEMVNAGKLLGLLDLLPYLSDDELDHLYRGARVFVVTSTYEGFHAPAMEAYLRGTPLVLPRREPFVSIYGDAEGVFWFDGTDADLVKAFRKAHQLGSFTPDSRVVDSVSYSTVGTKLKSVYEEVVRR